MRFRETVFGKRQYRRGGAGRTSLNLHPVSGEFSCLWQSEVGKFPSKLLGKVL